MPWPTYELERIRTPRLLLRCWTEADVPRMRQAIEESLEHLRTWMPWAAHEPQPVERKMRLVRRFRLKFELGRDIVYGIFDAETGEVLGGCGMHSRIGAGAAEIGYWTHKDQINKGYATEASAALVRVGFERLKLTLIEIHCDLLNEPSAAIPRKLGFRELPPIAGWVAEPDAEPRDTLIFRMMAAEYVESPAAKTPMEVEAGTEAEQ